MSFDTVPLWADVMQWDTHYLADYMRSLNLSGCDKMVMKKNLNGAQFLQMTETTLQMFPRTCVKTITKIHREIHRSGEKRGFGQRLGASRCPKQDSTEGAKAWDTDEFDSESDNEYEEPDEQQDSYICPIAQQSKVDRGDSEESSDDGYEIPPTDTAELPWPSHNLTKTHGKSDYIDSVRAPPPAARTPRPALHPECLPPTLVHHKQLAHPPPPRNGPFPNRPFKPEKKLNAQPGPAMPHFDRSKKPGHSTLLKPSAPKRDGSPGIHLPSSNNSFPQPRSGPPEQTNRVKKNMPCPHPPPSKPSKIHNSQLLQTKDLDPSWYTGQQTRSLAEAALRRLSKDGAFLVRDSSKGSSDQPYTLMVLNQGKVYNIQIRHHGNNFSLGTGQRKTETFPRLKEMIAHHTHTPLLLLDAMSCGAQSQCCLLHPAGL